MKPDSSPECNRSQVVSFPFFSSHVFSHCLILLPPQVVSAFIFTFVGVLAVILWFLTVCERGRRQWVGMQYGLIYLLCILAVGRRFYACSWTICFKCIHISCWESCLLQMITIIAVWISFCLCWNVNKVYLFNINSISIFRYFTLSHFTTIQDNAAKHYRTVVGVVGHLCGETWTWVVNFFPLKSELNSVSYHSRPVCRSLDVSCGVFSTDGTNLWRLLSFIFLFHSHPERIFKVPCFT